MPFANRDTTLLINISNVTGSNVTWNGGAGMFTAEASNWNGATYCALQVLSANNTFINVGASANLSANGAIGFTLPAGIIRAFVSGNIPTALTAAVSGMN